MSDDQNTAQRATASWGISDVLVGWVIAYVMAVIFGGLLLVASGHADTPQDELPITIIALTYPPMWIGFVGIPYLICRFKGRGIVADLGLRIRWADWIGLPAGVFLQLVMVPLVSLPWVALLGRNMDELGEIAQKLADRADGSPLGVVLLILTVGIGAPIAEEIFFRGLVLRGFERRFGTAVGVVASSVLFGLTHFQLLQFPALTVAGAAFALLAVRSKRLGPAILAHMAFNMVTVINLVWIA